MKPDTEFLCRYFYHYLSQGKTWYDAKTRPSAIVHMDPLWRYNAAKFLEKRAAGLEFYYSLGEINYLFGTLVPAVLDPLNNPHEGFVHLGPTGELAQEAYDNELDARAKDPVAWIRSTTLYRALMEGLPEDTAERVKHRIECPKRNDLSQRCTCGGSWRLRKKEPDG